MCERKRWCDSDNVSLKKKMVHLEFEITTQKFLFTTWMVLEGMLSDEP